MSQHPIYRSIVSEIKQNLSISVPLTASQMIYSCSSFLATAMVAQLGEKALAASILVNMIWWSLSVLFFGMLNSVSVLVSHQFGARNDDAISKIMGQAFQLGLILFVILISIMFASPFILKLSSQPHDVMKLAIHYMYSMTLTIPPLIILIIIEQFLAGINRTKMVLKISLSIVPIEIPLIYFLMFGKLGLPACGIAGIGFGFAITYTATAIFLILYLLYAKSMQRYAAFKNIFVFNAAYLKEFIKVGIPMGFMQLLEVGAFAIATFWIARFGTTILAAHQMVMQYLGFSITLVFAMSQAVTVRVGHAAGRLDLTEVKYAAYVGMFLNSSIMIIIAIGFIFFPHYILKLDINPHDANNQALMQAASILLDITGILIVLDNFRIIGFGALRGLKDTRFPMYSSLISFWMIGLSTAYLFAFVFHLDGKGIWYGLTCGIGCGAVIVLIRLHRLLKRVDLQQVVAIKHDVTS